MFLDVLLQGELDRIRQQGLFREMKRVDSMQGPTVTIDGKEVVQLSSNNYLGLANHPEVIKAQVQAAEEFGAGSSASRLISGNMSLHEKLERKIAGFKGTEEAILFPTGYMANVGAITALVSEKDLVVCDKLNHASIIDGVRLSGAVLRVYPHKNIERLEAILKGSSGYNKSLVITDGIFSMDGDIAPIPEIIKIAKKFNSILMVDDAHATAVVGKTGKGTCEYFDIEEGVDIQMGTLSKALGNLGGYIAGSKTLIEYICNKARPFIYSTALPPAVVGGSIRAIEIVQKDTALREKLWSNVEKFRAALIEIGFNIMESETQIIPVCIGDIEATMRAAKFLMKNNVLAPAVRPPTVPKNKCRLRTSLMATHTEEHIDKAIQAFKKLRKRYNS